MNLSYIKYTDTSYTMSQSPEKLDMQAIIRLYNSSSRSNNTFKKFMDVMRPMFNGTPDFSKVVSTDLIYKDGTKWTNEDYNNILAMTLESNNPDYLDFRFEDSNPENWERILELVKNKKIYLEKSSKAYKKYLTEIETKSENYDQIFKAKNDCEQKCKTLETELDVYKQKCKDLEERLCNLKKLADDWTKSVSDVSH